MGCGAVICRGRLSFGSLGASPLSLSLATTLLARIRVRDDANADDNDAGKSYNYLLGLRCLIDDAFLGSERPVPVFVRLTYMHATQPHSPRSLFSLLSPP